MVIPTALPFAPRCRLPRLCASLTAVLMEAFLFWSVAAQRVSSGPTEPAVRIEQELTMIQQGKQTGLPASKMGYLWATLADAYQDMSDWEKALAAYERALQLLGKNPEDKANYATVLDNMGRCIWSMAGLPMLRN